MASDLELQILNRLSQERKAIADQEKQLQMMQVRPTGPDLTPLMALADMWSGQPGSNLAGAYAATRPRDNTSKIQALGQQLMQQRQGLLGDELRLLALQKKGQEKALGLTPGEKKKDQEFAKEASSWDAAGGFASFAGNLDRLKQASADLAKEGDLANTVMPKAMRDVFKPESSALEENIGFVAQQSLKQILGGQSSEKEAKQLIERTYNPRLPDSVNKDKIDTLVKQLEAQGKAKERAVKYFNDKGTLKGFEGSSAVTLKEFEKESKDKIMNSDLSGEDKAAYEWAKKNPNDKRSKQILDKLGRK